MRLEPLYRVTFTTPEAWSVRLEGANGVEGHSFLIAEGRCEGRLSARYRGANSPRSRTDGVLLPDFRGVLETDDGATVLFAWQGYSLPRADETLQLLGTITHLTDDERYRSLNDAVCALSGEVRTRRDGSGYDVVLEVAELIWEPLED
jgi:Protein of unknown function (DUF3237)